MTLGVWCSRSDCCCHVLPLLEVHLLDRDLIEIDLLNREDFLAVSHGLLGCAWHTTDDLTAVVYGDISESV